MIFMVLFNIQFRASRTMALRDFRVGNRQSTFTLPGMKIRDTTTY